MRAAASRLKGGAASLKSDGSDPKITHAVNARTITNMGGDENTAALVPKSDINLVYININKDVWRGSYAPRSIRHESLLSTGVALSD